VLLPDGADGKGDGAQMVCVFWESETRARYFEDYDRGSFRYAPYFGSTSGMPGPVPKIEERAVDFGVTLRQQLKIMEIDKCGMRLAYVLTDGINISVEREDQPQWNDNQRINMFHGRTAMDIVHSPDFKTVDVEAYHAEPSPLAGASKATNSKFGGTTLLRLPKARAL
jgi:hypothetical protein